MCGVKNVAKSIADFVDCNRVKSVQDIKLIPFAISSEMLGLSCVVLGLRLTNYISVLKLRLTKSEFSGNFQNGTFRVREDPRNTNPSTKQFPDFGFMAKNDENGEKVGLAQNLFLRKYRR